MKTLLTAAAMALAFTATAPSFAQNAGVMTDKTLMGGFFSDDTMTTLRGDADLKAELEKMTPENRAKFLEECRKNDEHEQVYDELCDKVSIQ